jgi:hypothetical protein
MRLKHKNTSAPQPRHRKNLECLPNLPKKPDKDLLPADERLENDQKAGRHHRRALEGVRMEKDEETPRPVTFTRIIVNSNIVFSALIKEENVFQATILIQKYENVLRRSALRRRTRPSGL